MVRKLEYSMMFSKYMMDWLYGDYGYYAHYKEIGKEGDFYTAVSSSQFFGGSIANEILKLIETKFSKSVTICEIGAHKGYLLADIIQFIYTLKPELLETLSFVIVERFEHLQKKQAEYLRDSFQDKVEVQFVNSLTELHLEEAIFIANEIFDAFPCELYYKGKFGKVEGEEILFSEERPELREVAEKYGKDRGEIAVGYFEFAKEMVESAEKFQFITFDYGDMEARPDFSIRIYHKHKVFPLLEEEVRIQKFFGKSDITYDVNFAHLKDEFEKAGAKFLEYKTQMKALVDFGLIDLLQMLDQNVSKDIYHSELNRVKVLIDPAFMGERFKMMRFEKRETE
jgi:SAM-dependent MidA family methyltransferase